MLCKNRHLLLNVNIYETRVGISKGRRCCDLVNASYLLLVYRAYDAFARSQHLRSFEIPTPAGPYATGIKKKCPPDSLSASTVVGRRVCSRRPSHGLSGSFDDRRLSSRQTTIVPTKIAWCVPSLIGYFVK